MRTTILRLVCDDCGYIAEWETLNLNPLIVSLYPQEHIERKGWTRQKKIGSEVDQVDLCPTCTEHRRLGPRRR